MRANVSLETIIELAKDPNFIKEFQEEIRDGIPPRFIGTPPRWRVPQKPPKDLRTMELENKKSLKASGSV